MSDNKIIVTFSKTDNDNVQGLINYLYHIGLNKRFEFSLELSFFEDLDSQDGEFDGLHIIVLSQKLWEFEGFDFFLSVGIQILPVILVTFEEIEHSILNKYSSFRIINLTKWDGLSNSNELEKFLDIICISITGQCFNFTNKVNKKELISKGSKVFISYAKEDESHAISIYNILNSKNLNPWLDRENLLPGQDWDTRIRTEIQNSEFVVIILSSKSVSKRGYVQSELKAALKEFEKMPENQIFIIPVRVDDCNIPYSLQKLHVVDLFQNNGIDKVIQSIEYSQIKSNSVVDHRDGEVYATIEINGKTWLAENLRYLGGKGCWINGTNKDVFGYLYNLESAKEACIPGWHIPTYFEWMELVAYIDGFSTNDGYEDEYKEDEKIITIGSPSFEKSIQLIRSGFKVPLPGIRSEDDRFILKNKYASFWSSTFVSNEVWIWSFNLYSMYFHGDKLDLDSTLNIGMSCRCVKDFNHQTNWS